MIFLDDSLLTILFQPLSIHLANDFPTPTSTFLLCYGQFGCIPVVLSDELLWAYSIETGGFLNATSFSLQLPQKIVQLNAEDALEVSTCP